MASSVRSSFRALLVPSATYTLSTLWKTPRPQPQSRMYAPALWCLLVSMGEAVGYVNLEGVDVAPLRGVLHTFLAFSVLAFVEPIRLNRQDISPFFHVTNIVALALDVSLFYANLALVAVFLGVVYVVEVGLTRVYGPGISFASVLTSQLRVLESHFGSSVFVATAVIGPLTDLPETKRIDKNEVVVVGVEIDVETYYEKREYPFPCSISDYNKKFGVYVDFCARLFARKDTLRRLL
ncbi:hypothetical protein B0T26DRAFT_678452 [Lasiosphaeria miniovina]|uniref:Uncharacterized protein n=1 Tax=Lasiosphaeria miniovina TaxID=1954250 RepID=A0AA40A486_9PEZI|nr:uncharacterized protein B0T26DRAFT_678452 [Lasiosphaeria miniovina]KAK0708960.1 hypothetical protein B0T26DRAFT_678452 [Lasiosphaeria miniovina]